MRKKVLIAGAIALAWLALAVVAVNALIPMLFLNTGHIRGTLFANTVSPNGRWKVRIYQINVGAAASLSYYANVKDSEGKVPPHDIVLSDYQKTEIRWKNADTVDIFDSEINVRTGTVLEKISVSPTKRWKLQLFYSVPIDRRYIARSVNEYAKVIDLSGKIPTRKIDIDESQISGYRIRWKSADVVDVYGDVINVRKGRN